MVFHSIFLLKNSSSTTILDLNLDLISTLFCGEAFEEEKSFILGAIFPGLLTSLIQTILKRIKYSMVIAKTVEILCEVVSLYVRFEPDGTRVANVPPQLQKMFPDRKDPALKEKSSTIICNAVKSVMPVLLGNRGSIQLKIHL